MALRWLSWRVLLVFAAIVVALAGWHMVAGSQEARVYSYEVVRAYPHDPKAFTQGLVYDSGVLYESTGLEGSSSLRKVELESGRVAKLHRVGEGHFAEGLALWKDRLIQLTWRSGVAFVYDKESFRPLREFHYDGEGWGLTHDGRHLIMSDGTATLRFIDPDTFRTARELRVTDRGRPVERLNEMDYVKGEIFANVWRTNRIARISPRTGKILGWIDLEGILGASANADVANVDVLNGIAYDEAGDRLFVTGKFWPSLFEIRLVERPRGES